MTSAPAIRNSWAAKLPTSPIPMTSTVSPGCTDDERRAAMLTPAMREKTICSPGAPPGTGRAKRPASALTTLAWLEKLSTRSPGRHIRSREPTASTSPRLPYPVGRGYLPASPNGISFTRPVNPAPSVPALTMENSVRTSAWCGASASSRVAACSSMLPGSVTIS